MTESNFKKILKYYGLGVPVILGEAFAILRDRNLSEKERLAITYLGGATGLFDDFFDQKNISDIEIKSLFENPYESQPKNSFESLFVKFYIKALENASNPNAIKLAALKVYEAQIISKKQFDSSIQFDEI